MMLFNKSSVIKGKYFKAKFLWNNGAIVETKPTSSDIIYILLLCSDIFFNIRFNAPFS